MADKKKNKYKPTRVNLKDKHGDMSDGYRMLAVERDMSAHKILQSAVREYYNKHCTARFVTFCY